MGRAHVPASSAASMVPPTTLGQASQRFIGDSHFNIASIHTLRPYGLRCCLVRSGRSLPRQAVVGSILLLLLVGERNSSTRGTDALHAVVSTNTRTFRRSTSCNNFSDSGDRSRRFSSEARVTVCKSSATAFSFSAMVVVEESADEVPFGAASCKDSAESSSYKRQTPR